MNDTKLFKKDFTLIVLGQIISLFGNSILRFALPLYLLRQTGSSALFGMVSAVSFLPMIVLSLLGGVMADRVNKRNIMVVLDFGTALIIAFLSIALGSLPVVPLFIAVLMLLFGVQGAYQPAVQASIPAMVPEHQILPANAVINQVSALSGLVGPILGGILFSAWGLQPILTISIFCFLFSATMEIFIKIPFVRQTAGQGALSIVKIDLQESLAFIKKDCPILLRVTVLLALFNLVLGSFMTIAYPVLITKTLGLGDNLLGFAQGALAAGGLLGGVFSGIFAKKLDIKKSYTLLIFCSIILFPAGIFLMLNAPSMITYYAICVVGFVSMCSATIFNILAISFVQKLTPIHLVGKVLSCLGTCSMCAQPLGQALYGVLFQQLPTLPWAIIFGAASLSCVISLYSKRVFSHI